MTTPSFSGLFTSQNLIVTIVLIIGMWYAFSNDMREYRRERKAVKAIRNRKFPKA